MQPGIIRCLTRKAGCHHDTSWRFFTGKKRKDYEVRKPADTAVSKAPRKGTGCLDKQPVPFFSPDSRYTAFSSFLGYLIQKPRERISRGILGARMVIPVHILAPGFKEEIYNNRESESQKIKFAWLNFWLSLCRRRRNHYALHCLYRKIK